MKIAIGIFLLITRLYCGVKILIWLAQQNFSTNHPISEIQTFLVFLLLDLWISSTNREMFENWKDDY
jgi:hypothetical protein